MTKRPISGGTMSADDRQAHDVMLGLIKTRHESLASLSSALWMIGLG
ncbi:hypothetical protein [Paracoccus sediminis]|nr:hypothetical protein [Paracoccus sediminis]